MKITREGFRLILATSLIGLASLNTGNNLMYLILSVMLAIFFLSLLITYVNLRGIRIEIVSSDDLFAGKTSRIKLRYSKKRSFLSSRSFFITATSRAPLRILDYVDILKPGGSIEKITHITPLKRGMLSLKDTLILKTGFPFIFTENSIRPDVKGTLLIYPALKDIDLLMDSYTVDGKRPFTGERDFQKIRQYRYGDDRRFIHWKATAKTGELMIKESAIEEGLRITVFFDNFRPPIPEAFEESISFAASLSARFIEAGYYVRFITCLKTIPFGTGMEHLRKILDHLAIISSSDDFSCLIDEGESAGRSILILQSDFSPLMRFRDSAERIFYASEI
ncbi:MAG: DUF58 domain-containing protein [Thermodesulfovibrionales bacterium]